MFNNRRLEILVLTIYVVECKSLIHAALPPFYERLVWFVFVVVLYLRFARRGIAVYRATCADCRCAALACCCCLDCLF
jgi:hypothetical protein